MDKQHIDLRGTILDGRILDVGGGGEGVIARHCGNDVVVIDRWRDELEESPDIGLKIVMDGCDMQFLDDTFDNVTYFYSLMYMDEKNAAKSLREARRVLKSSGCLWIWDAVMPYPATAEIFLASLDIVLSDIQSITPTYGVSWHKGQTAHSVAAMCEASGFVIVESASDGQSFFLKAKKGRRRQWIN